MRHVSVVVALLAVAVIAAGCKKPKPKAKAAASARTIRPLKTLAPPPAPAPARLAPAAPRDSAAISQLPPAAPGPRRHTVRKGDTLYSLAKRYLGDGKRWKAIEAANPGLDHRKLPIGKSILIPRK